MGEIRLPMHPQSHRYLSAILAAGSISKAAQALGISQPSLSQFVQRIEKDLGAEVFDRSTRPLTLTESGRIFFEAEKRVAEIREDCRRAVQDINGGERGRVVVGASEYREMFFLTEVLPVFSAAHPGIEIALEEGTTRELEDFVWTGKTDVSLVISPLAQPGLEAVEIYEERLLLAVSEKSPLIEKALALCPEERRGDEFPPFPFRLLADELYLAHVVDGQHDAADFLGLLPQLFIGVVVAGYGVHRAVYVVEAVVGVVRYDADADFRYIVGKARPQIPAFLAVDVDDIARRIRAVYAGNFLAVNPGMAAAGSHFPLSGYI